MIVNGNGNIVAGRDIVISSTVDNRELEGIPPEYHAAIQHTIAQMRKSHEPKSVAASFIDRIANSAPVEVISAITKLIFKFI